MPNKNNRPLTVLPQPTSPTEVGNYFVANYPPFSLWTPNRRAEALDRLERKGNSKTPLGMYVHIPFCRKRCHFCYFRVYTGKNSNEIRQYLDAVIEEAAMISRRRFLAGRKLQYVYFGGGTPSYLSTRQLGELFDGLKRAMPWDAAEEITFECEPGTLNKTKVKAIAELGVTRLSLGIENFDDHVLRLNNRAHESKQVYAAYEWAQSASFKQINIDLIAGMLGETDQNWRRCIDQVLQMQPDVVTIYQMEIPYNTTIYKTMKADGDTIAPVADWSTKRRWVSEAFRALEAAGYTVSSAYTAVKDPKQTQFMYRDALWSGADMFGVGVSSFGHLDGVHYQNQPDIVPYISEVAGGTLPIHRALTMTQQEQMIRQFILQMKLGKLANNTFINKFGVDVFSQYDELLSSYEREGYLHRSPDELELTRTGLLQIDRLLHGFFLPEHRQVRYA